MIVIGADTHKQSHTVGALDGATGRVLADRTVSAKRRSFEDLLAWGRGVGADRVWAIEDCRHVSGALERFLLRRGERVVRVAPKLMADTRRSARERGKSDVIDAVAIARAALREGLDTLPISQLAGSERDVRLLVDHRACLVTQRTALINDLRWHPHDLSPELEIPPRALIGGRCRGASRAAWQEPSRPRRCGSRATNCAAAASSPDPPTPYGASSPAWRQSSLNGGSPSQGAEGPPPQSSSASSPEARASPPTPSS